MTSNRDITQQCPKYNIYIDLIEGTSYNNGFIDSQIDKSSYTTMVLANKPISLGLGFKKIVFLSLLIILREIFLPTGSTTELAKFTDVTLEVGINFQHENGRGKERYFIETIGSGGAWLDYNNDGNLDIYLVNATSMEDSPSNSTQPHTKNKN